METYTILDEPLRIRVVFNMLDKHICKNCNQRVDHEQREWKVFKEIAEGERDMTGAISVESPESFDHEWNRGYVTCGDRPSHSMMTRIENEPPDWCLYSLEHLLAAEERLVQSHGHASQGARELQVS